MWDDPAGDTPSGWVFRNNTFRNFYMAPIRASHSQAIYVGYSTNGLIEGNTFENNGKTCAHLLTWWGETAPTRARRIRGTFVCGTTRSRDGPSVPLLRRELP